MRRVRILTLFVALVAVLGVGNLMAQGVGFGFGIVPAFRAPVVNPGFAQPLLVPFGASSTFGVPGIHTPSMVNGGFGVHLGFGSVPFRCCVAPRVFVPGQAFVPGQIVAPGLGPIIVPGTVFPGFFPGRIFAPGVFQQQAVFPQATARPARIFVPGTIVIARFSAVPVAGLPPIGTPREQVVRQLGAPTVSIATSTGETLHFGGGVTIFIQNGQVASLR